MFQFYLSSIKRVISIKFKILKKKFQFYLSSIKRKCEYLHELSLIEFQFYLSSIKSIASIHLKHLDIIRIYRFLRKCNLCYFTFTGNCNGTPVLAASISSPL